MSISDDEVYEMQAPCPCCDGAGEWDEGPLPASSGASEPEYRQVRCGECEGTGRVDARPIDIDDLSEMAGDYDEVSALSLALLDDMETSLAQGKSWAEWRSAQ